MYKKVTIILGALLALLAIVIFFVFSTPKPEVKSAAISTSLATNTSTLEEKQYSLADVVLHNTEQSCWTTVDSRVYDITSFISKHPGGKQKILSICGKDGTIMFGAQHGRDLSASKIIESFYLGKLI